LGHKSDPENVKWAGGESHRGVVITLSRKKEIKPMRDTRKFGAEAVQQGEKRRPGGAKLMKGRKENYILYPGNCGRRRKRRKTVS